MATTSTQAGQSQQLRSLFERLSVINADSYYEVGAGHIYCQDYAHHGTFAAKGLPFHFAVVSDGCSGSTDSDLGARFMARNFSKAAMLVLSGDYTNLVEDIKRQIIVLMNSGMNMDIPACAFDATLVALLYDVAKDTLHTFAWGDGNIFYKFRKGDNGTLTNISYLKNAPFYINYERRYMEMDYESRFGTMYADVVPYVVSPDNAVAVLTETQSYQKFHYQKFEKVSEVLLFASVFTDGVETYHNKDNMNVLMPRHNVYNQLTKYKGVHGRFVERRMLMVKKFCQKEGWQHYDDVAAATISF